MLSSLQQSNNKVFFHFLFWICLCLSLSACENKAVEKPIEIITLDKTNVKSFTLTFSQDYMKTRKELLTAFHSHKDSGDSYGFTKFRNHTWTPVYAEKKAYYQAVLNKNRDYISSTNIKPLFLRFENLIYIGISLKNGLLDNDEELMKSTLAEVDADLKIVQAIVK